MTAPKDVPLGCGAEGTVSEHADLLNTLEDMAGSYHYALRREVLRLAGRTIMDLERRLSEERSRARELWTALANLSFHCDGVVVTCPPPRTVYNQSFAVMDRFKPLYGPEAPKK